MKLYDPGFWRRVARPFSKGAGAGSLAAIFGRNGFFPSTDYRALVREGYQGNEVVYAGVTAIVQAFAQAPVVVKDEKGVVVEGHALPRLLSRPNPWMTGFEFWSTTLAHLYLAGTSFWEKVRDKRGRVIELWPLQPDRVRIFPDPDRFIAGYDYLVGGERFPLAAEDVTRLRFASPSDDFWGQSPLRPAFRRVLNDNETNLFSFSLVKNAAIPGVVIMSEDQFDPDGDEGKAFLARWKEKFRGERRGEPAVLSRVKDVKVLSFSPSEMALPDLTAANEARILAVLRVPPIIVGVKVGLDRSTFSNYEEARRSLYEDAIFPLYNMIDDVIDSDLMRETIAFEGGEARPRTGLKTVFDTREVPALDGTHDRRFTRAGAALTQGWITRNEARAQVGLPAVPAGDVFLVPISTISTPAAPRRPASAPAVETEEPANRDGVRRPKIEFPKALKARVDDVELQRFIFGRIARAELYLDRLTEWARGDLSAQMDDVLAAVRKGTKALTPEQYRKITREIEELGHIWPLRSAEGIRPLLSVIIGDAAESAAAEIGAEFALSAAEQAAFVRSYSFKFAEKVGADSVRGVREIIERAFTEGRSDRQIIADLGEVSSGWTTWRADRIARSEVVRASNRGAVEAWKASGVETVRWNLASDACPYCAELAAKFPTFPIGSTLYKIGDQVTPGPITDPETGEERAVRPLAIDYEAIETPPLHPFCRCALSAL